MKTHQINPSVSFGILKTYRKTPYGSYMKGVYKEHNIEIYDAKKYNQKLQYVSDKFLNWVKSKLIYFDKGIKKVTKSENHVK